MRVCVHPFVNYARLERRRRSGKPFVVDLPGTSRDPAITRRSLPSAPTRAPRSIVARLVDRPRNEPRLDERLRSEEDAVLTVGADVGHGVGPRAEPSGSNLGGLAGAGRPRHQCGLELIGHPVPDLGSRRPRDERSGDHEQ